MQYKILEATDSSALNIAKKTYYSKTIKQQTLESKQKT